MRHSHQRASAVLSGQIPYSIIREPVASIGYPNEILSFALYPSFSRYVASISLVVHTYMWSTLAGVKNELYRQAFYNAVYVAEGRRRLH